jgi:hypothetical protein
VESLEFFCGETFCHMLILMGSKEMFRDVLETMGFLTVSAHELVARNTVAR